MSFNVEVLHFHNIKCAVMLHLDLRNERLIPTGSATDKLPLAVCPHREGLSRRETYTHTHTHTHTLLFPGEPITNNLVPIYHIQ